MDDAAMGTPHVLLRLIEFRPPEAEHGGQQSIRITLEVNGERKSDTAFTDDDIVYAIVNVFRKLVPLPHDVKLVELPNICEKTTETTVTGRLRSNDRWVIAAVKDEDKIKARILFVLGGFSQIMRRRS